MRTAGLVAAGAAATALGYASLIERNMFTLRRFDVPVLAPDAEPLRVLHLSDAHLTPGQRRKQEWVAALAATDPDLVVVTGDNLAHPAAVPAVARMYGPLLDLPGVFVFGSNDYAGPVWHNPLRYLRRDRAVDLDGGGGAWRSRAGGEMPGGGGAWRSLAGGEIEGAPLPYEDLRALLVGAGWTDLNNARTMLKAGGRTIEAVGVDDPHVARDDYPAVAGPASPAADLHLGLTHSPEPAVLDAMAADGFTLLLAGHTHGGQVRVPGVGALVTNCGLDRRLARGLHRWQGTAGSWLHVSAGLGTHPTAPIRFACRPEASILTLIPR